jgi:sulfate transport system substrate-binding protein
MFSSYWKDKTRQEVEIHQSHGGSSKQARSVIDGLRADVVTLATAQDIHAIANKSQLFDANWQQAFAHDSTPYYSTVVFLVRKGNAKNIYDWDDLLGDGVSVITANPKTSGGGKWNYLAAWAYANWRYDGNEAAIIKFMRTLFSHVPVLDAGARGATMTFAQREMGDVLITWENEAILAQQSQPGKYTRIYPSISILAQPPVAVVEKVTLRKSTQDVAKGYLAYLYSPEAQKLVAQFHYRPSDEKIMQSLRYKFPRMAMVSVAELGGWQNLQKKHFDEDGTFDQIYSK